MDRKSVDIKKVSPMMRQYLEIKEKNEDIILFFRLGDFYEMFFDDATLVSHLLELTLTGKNAGLEEKIPMCGIPHHASDMYLEKLVDMGYKVGICEQLSDPKTTKGIVERGIVRIVSKGTITSEESLDEKSNNYLGCLLDVNHMYILTYTDISTGEVITTKIDHKESKVISEVVSLGIKEIIVLDTLNKNLVNILKNTFGILTTIVDKIENIQDYNYIYEDIEDDRIIKSIKYLLTYINDTQKRILSHLNKVLIKENNEYLKMDIHTKRNLELVETLRLKTRENSLLDLLDKTKTAMGSRYLKNNIENPLINKNKIETRYDRIDKLLVEFIIKDDLSKLLYEIYDLERLSGKIAFGSANARDMLQLKQSINVLPSINECLKKLDFDLEVEQLNNLYKLLDDSIHENPPMSLKEGYLIKEGYNSELDELKTLRKGGKDFVARFEEEEKERTGIKNLKIGYNRVFGYYIEVSKGNVKEIKEEYGYERRQTLTNCERYISPILKEKEALILNAEEKIVELEYNLFIDIRNEVKKYIPKLQGIAKIISEIDLLQSLATIAEDNNYIRPTITDKKEIKLVDSRHPIVEKVLNNSFVSNDIMMDDKTDILLITGPNMAGKSTYMRQLAIIVIMAQLGSFVPAKEASIPLIDAIYTRIGASDDLVSGESTFMVEMNEAANAIKNATENSLILFDELGRGTATFDGMAIAQSIIEYIAVNIKCKTMFSTHYHEITDLSNSIKTLKNVHVSAIEEEGKITFLHKVKDGSVDKSYGIHVAKLASLPDALIKRANDILKVYENTEVKRDTKIQESFDIDSLIEKESKVEKKLKELDILNITPIDALTILNNLKEEVGE